MKKISIVVILMLLSQGCQSPQPTSEKSSFIVWKSAKLKYADMGFISANDNGVIVEIYGSGVAVMHLDISSDRICMSRLECMDKRKFNKNVLSSYYPDDILSNIFRSKEIFDGLNLKRRADGFEQRISTQGQYDILYVVTKNGTIFEDKQNSILIKVKNL